MPAEILLVEDNPGDIRLMTEAFRRADSSVDLHVAYDGVEALAFLRHQGDYLNAPRPDCILLDLNLPKLDGREVLSQIKQDDNLKTIPTIILSSSVAEADIMESYRLHANCYLAKPAQLADFDRVVKSLSDFWLTMVKLPVIH